jgi:hypothetical protein
MTDTDLAKIVEELRNSMKGLGTVEETVIRIIKQFPLVTRLKIKEQYKITYGRELQDDFKSELGGNFYELTSGLFKNIYEYDADQCHRAIEGLGTNEDTLIEIIGTRPKWLLNGIKVQYKKLYNRDLEEDVKNDTSGDFQQLLISLLQCARSDNEKPDVETCSKIAEELHDSENNKLGIGQTYNKYVANCSASELMMIAREFHKKYGKSLMKEINEKFSGDIKKLIQTVFYSNISPSEYFATRIRESIKGVGTDEKILNRVIITRNEIDIKIIIQYYKLLYSEDMIKDIQDDTSGDYKTLLTALITK